MTVTRTQSCSGRARSGFTLIELLVVVSIIAVLASILFPVFIRARRQVASTVCKSNLRQIGLANRMYMDDNDDTFAVAADHNDRFTGYAQPDATPTPFPWEVLMPYTSTQAIWRCPGDTGYTASSIGLDFTPNTFESQGSSFIYRTDIVWDADANAFHPLRLSDLKQPEHNYLFAESVGWWHNSLRGSRGTSERASNRYNILTPSGRVRNVSNDELWTWVMTYTRTDF